MKLILSLKLISSLSNSQLNIHVIRNAKGHTRKEAGLDTFKGYI